MNVIGRMIPGGSGPKKCLICTTKPAPQGLDYCGKTCADWAKNYLTPAKDASLPPLGPSAGSAPGWGGYKGYGPPPSPGSGPPPQQQGQWGGYGQYSQQSQQAPQAPGQMMCQHCHVKPVLPAPRYCSNTCEVRAKIGRAEPPMQPSAPGPPAPGYGGSGSLPGHRPPQGLQQSPQQQGGPWGGPPQGGQPWGAPQQNGGQGRPPRQSGRSSLPGGYGGDDGEGPDDNTPPQPPKRAPISPPKGAKMCINCGDNPSVGKLEFCSKTCKAEAEDKLSGKPAPLPPTPQAPPPKATKMCINCGDNPSMGRLEFCSKTCEAGAEEKLSGGKRPVGHRRVGES